MDTTASIDLTQVASEFSLPLERIERTIELLDEGNTVPFITRFRKDQTRGLDEQQIRSIQQRIAKLRMLAERKSTILRSIDSQGKLTQEFAENIRRASSTKVLEDLYLPFKPKKQTLATLARQRGLEPLANEIHEGTTLAENLAARAAEFVRVDRQVSSVDEVMQGVGHLLAERFGERADLRDRLRKIFWSTGKLVSADITKTSNNNTSSKSESSGSATSSNKLEDSTAQSTTEGNPRHDSVSESAESPQSHQIDSSSAENSVTVPDGQVEETQASNVAVASSDVGSFANGNESQPASTGDSEPSAKGLEDANEKPIAAKQTATKNKKKKRKEDAAFEDYYNFQEPVSRVPPHRILAINRGERAKMLRPRIEVDEAAVKREAEELLIPPDHPHADFLRDCVQDALARLVMPTLEREIRRELTEMAEGHAVQVFARNLRKLLLQPPVRRHRVLAIDPGYRSGCKMCAVDEVGNLVADGVIHVVGNEERRKKGREDLVKMIREANVSVVAIGNGTACRQTEQLIADVISDELKDLDFSYVIVNEAGASVYSTSATGREELPEQDAAIRSAISIGRRLLDPLSELVKINPANLGVGLYQHDVKAKQLQESLDAVVESCVNFVGVDVNTASPSLLRYVSGLNQLTARRMYEYRQEHGLFKNREQFKEVPGFGEATFVQAAGFLKIIGGDNPLEATWIHPESYAEARRVLEKLGANEDDLSPKPTSTTQVNDESNKQDSTPETQTAVASSDTLAPPRGGRATEQKSRIAEKVSQVDVSQLSAEMGIGKLLLEDILSAISRPGRDPRDDLTPPIFRRGIMKLEDLEPGMELAGTVLNVVDFGAFVDIGLNDSGLVHISRLADRYISDPHEVVSVGDVIGVWVLGVDKERRRVSLTAIRPGSERSKESRGRKPSADRRPQQTRHRKPAAGRGNARPHRDKQRSSNQIQPQKKRKPKPVTPITDAMASGDEPLRSFSDLKQFFEKQEPEETEKADNDGSSTKE